MLLNVLNDIKTRVCEQIFVISYDNLPGISNAIKATYPNTDIQKCVVYQNRNNVKFVNYKELKPFTLDMKKIYRASNYESAKLALDNFGTKWGEKYSYAYKSWVNNFEELTTFFDYTPEIRKIIYTTNPIENLNRSIRKCTKNKGSFQQLNL